MSAPRAAPRRVLGLVVATAAMFGGSGCALFDRADKPEELASGPNAALYAGLGDSEIRKAQKNRQVALEKLVRNRSLTWTNGTSGSKGEATPIRTYKTVEGFYCREFVEAVETPDLGRRVAVNTACRDSDGRWKLVMK